MSSATLPLPAETPTGPVSRFTVEQYHRMIDAGVLTADDPVELIEGWIVPKMPQHPEHDHAGEELEELIEALLPVGWYLRSQRPITTADSEPEPDIAVARGRRADYRRRHPGPQDLALVAEVARTSVRGDRSTKPRVYARAGIPEYWLAIVPKEQIEAFSDPSPRSKPPRYRRSRVYSMRDSVPLRVGGVLLGRIAVSDVFSDDAD